MHDRDGGIPVLANPTGQLDRETIVTKVDGAWDPSWVGTEQVRYSGLPYRKWTQQSYGRVLTGMVHKSRIRPRRNGSPAPGYRRIVGRLGLKGCRSPRFSHDPFAGSPGGARLTFDFTEPAPVALFATDVVRAVTPFGDLYRSRLLNLKGRDAWILVQLRVVASGDPKGSC